MWKTFRRKACEYKTLFIFFLIEERLIFSLLSFFSLKGVWGKLSFFSFISFCSRIGGFSGDSYLWAGLKLGVMSDFTYDYSDLVDFVSGFGRRLVDCPMIFPSFNNYYQDIGVGGSRLGNLTKVNGELLYTPQNADAVYPDFGFKWYLNDELVSELGNPSLSDLKPTGCSGVMRLRLEIEHKPTRSYAVREEWCYLQYLDLGVCEPMDGAPNQWGVFVPFYPNVDDYHYMGLEGDFNGNGVVDGSDLTVFLSMYKG